MLRFAILILILTSCAKDSLSYKDKLLYQPSGQISSIKQPKSMACWITVTTMMISWKMNQTLNIDTVIKKLGSPWDIYYLTNVGLPEMEQKKFHEVIGLVEEPPASYTLEAYIDMLKQHGPIWITTSDMYSAHARLLVAIYGDGTYQNTYFEFIDPLKGKKQKLSFLKFINQYEEEAKYIVNNQLNHINLRWQIYHW